MERECSLWWKTLRISVERNVHCGGKHLCGCLVFPIQGYMHYYGILALQFLATESFHFNGRECYENLQGFSWDLPKPKDSGEACRSGFIIPVALPGRKLWSECTTTTTLLQGL